MKNILIFAGFAGIASAIAIYFVTENIRQSKKGNSNYNIETFDKGIDSNIAGSY